MTIKEVQNLLFGTLRGRLILGVASVNAVIMLIFTFYFTIRQRDALIQRQKEECVAFSQTLAVSAAEWLSAYDISGLQELVDAQRQYPELVFAILTDKEGHILAHTDRSKKGKYLLDLPHEPHLTILTNTPGLTDIAVPAFLGGSHVGWARIGMGQQMFFAKLSGITKMGILYAIASILFGSLMAWLMGRGVTRRLYVIQDTVNKVSQGYRAARILLKGNDEASVLASQFNAMLDALDERDLELEKSEKRFQKLFNNATVPLCLIAKNGELLDANKSFIQTFGYSSEDVPTIDDWWILAYPDPEYRRLSMEAWNTEVEMAVDLKTDISPREYLVACKNGEVRTVVISGTLLSDGILASFIDVSERKQAEIELIQAKEKAEESDRLKSAFLANMSHEIRTPMNSILGFSELLKEPALSSEKQQQYLQVIETNGGRMLNTLNDILDISRIESGQLKVYLSEVDINTRLSDICMFFSQEAARKGIQFEVSETLPEQEAMMITDHQKVDAILTNLVKNALKFTNEGRIEIGCRLKNSGEGSADVDRLPAEYEFFVKDTGIGVHPNQKYLIFERFRQGAEALDRMYEGTGLGLAISKAYVEKLGGKIWLESEQGKGSVFYFTLPDLKEKPDGMA